MVVVSGIFSQELDELRIGMPVSDAVSVFTRFRSCENAVLLETPGKLAWKATMFGRETSIKLGILDGTVASLLFEFFLEPDDSGDALLKMLEAGETESFGQPSIRINDHVSWSSGGVSASLRRTVDDSSRLILLFRTIP